jgi:hypothetical protein
VSDGKLEPGSLERHALDVAIEARQGAALGDEQVGDGAQHVVAIRMRQGSIGGHDGIRITVREVEAPSELGQDADVGFVVLQVGESSGGLHEDGFGLGDSILRGQYRRPGDDGSTMAGRSSSASGLDGFVEQDPASA